MMRSCRFHPKRFFRFVMAPLALISLTFIGAAQQKPAADAITGSVLGDDGNPLVNASISAFDPKGRGPNRINRSTKTDDEGYFRLTKLPPGEYQISASAEGYLLLARAASDAESSEAQPRPAAWSADSRAKLRREARTAKVEIELQACQRVMDYVLRYEPR